MLKSIDINGLAVVDQLNLELNTGMTVLTGETGAGKSILLTAMKLCLGERADAGLLRPGVNKADISLDFDISNTAAALSWLQENEFDDDNDCLIRRTVNADGRSRAFINGQAVNLKTLQQLSEHLICIHGQHAHLDLLLPAKQSQLLDASLTSTTALDDCNQRYEKWKTLNDELLSLTDGNEDNDSEKQLLKYQINELEQANVVHLNYDELVQEHSTASNMGKIIELAEMQINALYEDENHAIHTQLSSSSSELEQLADLSPQFSSISEQIKEATIQIQEASRDLRHQIDQQDDDPQQLALLDGQLSLIHELARKLHIEPQQLLEKHSALANRLSLLENRNERLTAIQQEISDANALYQKAAEALHQQRVKAAKKLSLDITKTLKTLGLPDGHIDIQVVYTGQKKPQTNGLDDINFLVTTNPGMPASPIGKVASGGELSRISLAIQVVTTQSNTTPTLVFDEVDAGIGGGVAETVGMCLREIAADRQVLCVTHLPQVASQGHQHLFVSKNKDSEQTKTQINVLHNKTRIEEIARMLGGIEMSEKTLAHAQEMLDKAI
ncbi:MAG TPA: DNA repair protein RecN [Cycloclasticus sp.]|jgi:DNA repair protein RecN (Recombination protein N)|nr:DNA repair protein RecN [Cycloclasticus sp.]HIL92579.1 DNA repair protein RecN [Cycloclasticus sp.]